MKESIQKFKAKLKSHNEKLSNILSEYQPHNVTEYEIDRCIRTIDGLEVNNAYLNISDRIDSMAVMLPSNLPLYSLFIFAIIPSLICKSVNVRPNAILQEQNIISRIYDELELEDLFPEVKIINEDHAGFKVHIQTADLVVFTGKPSNGTAFLKEMKKESILAINGAGHNPVIVTETADINKAVEGAVMLKGFNGGQDCAGPDAILVHHAVSQEFIEKFQQAFSSLKIGQFNEPETVIGPIHRFSELQRLASLIHQNNKDVISGGSIDFKNSIVQPTVIVRGIERYPNYKEVYGPIAFIHTYKEDKDLSYYFEDLDGQYPTNKMYVSVYGNSPYAMARNDTTNPGAIGNIGIVLHNETIHEVEIGYNAYGGYSMGASGLIKKSSKGLQQTAMPILLPQVIADYLIDNKDLPSFQSKQVLDAPIQVSTLKTGKQIDPIILDFQKIVTDVFKNTYAFSFVFGSAAKGKLKTHRDDLDTFICLKEEAAEAVATYNHLLAQLHHQYNLKVDETYPAEIMTLSSLEEAITYCSTLDVSIHETISGPKFDNLFWVHALSDKKIGFMGDGRLMSSLIKKSQSNILRWKNQIMEQIRSTEELPAHLKLNFSGLNKNQIIEKLEKFSPHLVVHLGLSYLNDEPSVSSEPIEVSTPSQGLFHSQSNITFFPGVSVNSNPTKKVSANISPVL